MKSAKIRDEGKREMEIMEIRDGEQNKIEREREERKGDREGV